MLMKCSAAMPRGGRGGFRGGRVAMRQCARIGASLDSPVARHSARRVKKKSASAMAIKDSAFYDEGECMNLEQEEEKKLAPSKPRPSSSSSSSNSPPVNLTELVCLQSTSGEFRWGAAMEALLGMRKAETEAKRPRGATEGAWLTALALAALAARMAGERELWELVAEKAERFVEKEAGGAKEAAELKEAAEKAIQG